MKTFQIILSLLIGFIIGGISFTLNQNKIDLPEEYKLITKNTPIRGYMNKDSILVIEFVNNKSSNIKFEWEGLDKDIPEDGIRELQLTTNGDIVYLNPVDQ